MCCDGWDSTGVAEEILECPACGEKTDEDGDALIGCAYSPIVCNTCGWRPCDQSC